MNLRITPIKAALAASLAFGMAGQAQAYIYAGSSLHLDNFSVGFGDFTGPGGSFNPATGNVTLNSFTFTTTNTAVLNGNPAPLASATCTGTPASNDCNTPGDTLYGGPANAPGSAPLRGSKVYAGADSTFEWFGAGTGANWSNSDSIIHNAEAVNIGTPTETDQIAEAKLTGGETASSSSRIDSVTGFTFSFTLTGPNPSNMFLQFDADVDMIAEAQNELVNGYVLPNALASVGANVNLTSSNNVDGFSWAPQGTPGVNNCVVDGVGTCVETADGEDLNRTLGVTSDGTTATHSYDPNAPGLSPFGIAVSGLHAGDWTLTLSATTSTLLSHRSIPEPSSLALLGLGMVGLGFAARRRKQA